MSVNVNIVIQKKVADIDKANDWIAEVKDRLVDAVDGTFQSSVTNSSPPEELTQEQESE